MTRAFPLVLLCCSMVVPAALAQVEAMSFANRSIAPRTLSLEEVASIVSHQNYLVRENALRVYQSKEAIKVARGNLLPKLNFWRWIAVPFDSKAYLGLVEDIAPFLIPSNWSRVKQSSRFYEAQKDAFKAVLANELMSAKTLFIHIKLDEELLAHIRSAYSEVAKIADHARLRETLSDAPQGTAKELQVRLLSLKEDQRALEALIAEEKGSLSYMLGFKDNPDLALAKIKLPDFSKLKSLKAEDYESLALDRSPELSQYEKIIEAARSVRREAKFTLFGLSSLSRGVAGGAFDSLPIQNGLGFGTTASVRVAKSQVDILGVQKEGVTETLKRQVRLIVNTYNLDAENYSNLKRRKELTQEILDNFRARIALGEQIDSLSLVEASRNQIQADFAFFGVMVRLLSAQEKLDRVTFSGDYERTAEIVQKSD